jgi:hypothetical protein
MFCRIVVTLVIATISVLQAATFDTLSGMVKNETGAVVSGAFVSLVRQPFGPKI